MKNSIKQDQLVKIWFTTSPSMALNSLLKEKNERLLTVYILLSNWWDKNQHFDNIAKKKLILPKLPDALSISLHNQWATWNIKYND